MLLSVTMKMKHTNYTIAYIVCGNNYSTHLIYFSLRNLATKTICIADDSEIVF